MSIVTTKDKTAKAGVVKTLQPVFLKYPEIVFAYLFGSLAEGTCRKTSDVDLAVYVAQPHDFSFSRKLQLHGDCCRALQRNDVDLVILNQTRNVILVEQIVTTGEIILNRDQDLLDDYVVRQRHQAIDFRLHRKSTMGV